MKKNRKNGFTLIELLIVIAIIAILAAMIPKSIQRQNKRMTINTIQGKLIAEPGAGVVHEKTAADPLAMSVVAIPRDKYYTEGTQTLHRVLVRVNNRAIVDAPIGTLFIRDDKGQDRIVEPIRPAQTNWVDYGTDVVAEVIPAK